MCFLYFMFSFVKLTGQSYAVTLVLSWWISLPLHIDHPMCSGTLVCPLTLLLESPLLAAPSHSGSPSPMLTQPASTGFCELEWTPASQPVENKTQILITQGTPTYPRSSCIKSYRAIPRFKGCQLIQHLQSHGNILLSLRPMLKYVCTLNTGMHIPYTTYAWPRHIRVRPKLQDVSHFFGAAICTIFSDFEEQQEWFWKLFTFIQK